MSDEDLLIGIREVPKKCKRMSMKKMKKECKRMSMKLDFKRKMEEIEKQRSPKFYV